MAELTRRHEYDVVVIGAGGAGLRAAIEAHESGARTAVVCKSLLGKAHTVMAEGGIAAAHGQRLPRGQLAGALPRHHARRQDAQPLAHGAAARPGGARPGAASWRTGARCSTAPTDGLIRQRDFGGHRYARLAHVGDRTGLELIRTLQQHAVALGHRRLHGVHGHPAAHGRRAASPARSATGASPGGSSSSRRQAVVLATGGIGKAYKVTSNSWEYTGDGHALALRAGADADRHGVRPVPPDRHGLAAVGARHPRHRGRARRRRHPARTPRASGSCSTTSPTSSASETAETEDEADRWYDDKKNNRRPPELLPRDEVARAINTEVKAGRGTAARRRLPRHRLAPVGRVHPASGCRRCTTSSRSWPTSTSPRSRWRSARPATT